jgi:5-formyltetrahydrofolate cyclo-ligase
MAAGPMPGIIIDSLDSIVADERFAARRALRKSLLERRLALTADECVQLSCRVRTHLRDGFPQLSALAVGFCWPLQNEADLRPLIDEWASEGKPGFRALLPVVIDERRALAFRAWSAGTAMFADRYGIPTPACGDFLIPEVLLLPVNGFDAAGYRIGYGGGYFLGNLERAFSMRSRAASSVAARAAEIESQPAGETKIRAIGEADASFSKKAVASPTPRPRASIHAR